MTEELSKFIDFLNKENFTFVKLDETTNFYHYKCEIDQIVFSYESAYSDSDVIRSGIQYLLLTLDEKLYDPITVFNLKTLLPYFLDNGYGLYDIKIIDKTLTLDFLSNHMFITFRTELKNV